MDGARKRPVRTRTEEISSLQVRVSTNHLFGKKTWLAHEWFVETRTMEKR